MKNNNLKFKMLAIAFFAFFAFSFTFILAHQLGSQNIDTKSVSEHWAWNDVISWIDLHDPVIHNVEVNANEIKGWANSSVGYIVFNCATTPNGNICGSSNFKVSNDGNGLLSGWAWSENIGWISFCGNTTEASTWDGSKWTCPLAASYRVRIDKDGVDESHFKDWAWNDVIGWISFNCDNDISCATSNYKIQTSAGGLQANAMIESNVFDTGSSQSYFNTVLWRGSQPAGTSVQVELATSNDPNGPWVYNVPISLLVNTPTKLIGASYINRRYIRYRVTLISDIWQSASPVVDDIIISWSP